MSLLDEDDLDQSGGGPPQVNPGAPTFANIQSGPQSIDPAQQLSAGPAATPTLTPARNAFQSFLYRLGQMRDNLSSNLTPNPTALVQAGLITPEDVSHARKGNLLRLGLSMLSEPAMSTFGQGLAHGVQNMVQGYNEQLQEPIQQQNEALQYNYQRGLLQARAQIGQMYAPQPGDSPQAIVQKRLALAQHLQSIGDLEGAKAAGSGLDGAYSNVTQPLKIDWQDVGNMKVPVDQFGRRVPWLQPMAMTGKPMSDDAKGFATERLLDARATAASNREDRLVQQYDADTKGYKTAADQIDQGYSALPAAKNGNAAAQQSLLYNVMNLEHPGESVPRNQITQYAQSLGPAEQLRLFGSKLTKGQAALTQAQVAQLEGVLREAHGRVASQMAPISTTYAKRAKAQGVDPSVFIDPTELLNQKWGTPSAATAAPAAGSSVYSPRNPYATGRP